MNKKLNMLYILNTFSYFAMFASMFSYVSVYLLDKDYTNSTIGTVLSLTGLLAILLQTATASFLDKRPNFRLPDALSFNLFIILLGTSLLFFVPRGLGLLLLIILIFSLTQASETLMNTLAFIFEKFNVQINYGLGRGMGSLSFALTTMLVGNVVSRTSPEIIPVFYFIFAFLGLIAIRLFRHPHEQPKKTKPVDQKNVRSERSMRAFIRQYKRLLVVMVGIGLLMFMHILINNFFIQIILPIGGNSATMGNAIFLGAILELPTMFNYKQIEKRSSAGALLRVAALFFIIKHLITFFAMNMWMIYIAQVFQIGAFALMYPAGVSYVHSVVAEKDLVKGQSLFTSAMALSSIAGNFAGGLLLDQMEVSATLFIGVIATALGAGVVCLATAKPSVQP